MLRRHRLSLTLFAGVLTATIPACIQVPIVVGTMADADVIAPVPAIVDPYADAHSSEAIAEPEPVRHPVPLDTMVATPVLQALDTSAIARAVPAVTIDSAHVATMMAALPKAIRPPLERPSTFASPADAAAWDATAKRARAATGLFLIVSLETRTLYAIRDADTLRIASVAVGSGQTLVNGKRTWVFETPRGVRTVLGKATKPIWNPPLWHYVETAQKHGLTVKEMPASGALALSGDRRLEVKDSLVGLWTRRTGWRALPVEDEIVLDGVLYVPPVGTKNRAHEGQLGPFKLDLGDGYLLHGTPHQHSIGQAVTHGCVRLNDEDLTWLYTNIPVGTRVYIL